jgi:hypothetical protein
VLDLSVFCTIILITNWTVFGASFVWDGAITILPVSLGLWISDFSVWRNETCAHRFPCNNQQSCDLQQLPFCWCLYCPLQWLLLRWLQCLLKSVQCIPLRFCLEILWVKNLGMKVLIIDEIVWHLVN